MVVQKGVHKQTHNHQEHEEHASTNNMNKRSSKIHLHGSINNKGMDRELCQKDLLCSFKTMNIKVLGIFQ